MEFLFKYFWAIAIAIAILNIFLLKRQMNQRIEQDPELESGYDTLINGFAIFMTLPWLVMGFGILTGKTENMFQYLLRPDFNNTAIVAFWVTVVALMLLSGFWIFFNGGAETLEKHPGFVKANMLGKQYDRLTSNQIKLTWLGSVIVFAVILYFIWGNHIPFPPVK